MKDQELQKTLADISAGTTQTLEGVEQAKSDISNVNEKVMSIEEALAIGDEKRQKTEAKVTELASALEGQSEKMVGLRKLLNHELGESGANDWLNIFGKWMMGVYHHKKNGRVPDQYKLDGYDYSSRGQKANATTQDDGNAGFLIPDILHPQMVMTQDIFGNLLPLVNEVKLAPGTTLNINNQATRGNASWRCAECTPIPETEILLNQLSVNPCLLGGIVNVSQELFAHPSANFSEIIAENMIRSIVEQKELALIQADDGVGGAAAPPHDGFLVDAGVNDIAAGLPAAPDIGDYIDFINAAVANYSFLARQDVGTLFIPLSRWFELMSGLVSGANVNSSWASMIPGAGTSPMGYKTVPHEYMTVGATDWAAFLNPRDIFTASSGSVAIDVNPFGSGWTSNCLAIKVYTYYDYVMTNADKMSKGDYTP